MNPVVVPRRTGKGSQDRVRRPRLAAELARAIPGAERTIPIVRDVLVEVGLADVSGVTSLGAKRAQVANRLGGRQPEVGDQRTNVFGCRATGETGGLEVPADPGNDGGHRGRKRQ